jgi:hypothetical protein
VDRCQTGLCKTPVFWRLVRLEKRLDLDSATRNASAARRHAPSCMGATDGQSNWQEMRKTLGKPGFLSGEAKNRTFRCFTNVLGEFEKHIDLASRSWCALVCRSLLRGQLDKKRGDCPRMLDKKRGDCPRMLGHSGWRLPDGFMPQRGARG